MKDNKYNSNEETETKKGSWVDSILEKFGVERYAEEFEDDEEEEVKEAPEVKKAEPIRPVTQKAEIKKETVKAEPKEIKYPKAVVETTNQTKNSGGNMNTNYEETSAKMRVFTPTEVSEVREVCDELRKGYAVVVNTDNLTEADYCRFYDFVYGAAYMIDGKVSQISDTVLILTPATIDISNAVREEEVFEEVTEENIIDSDDEEEDTTDVIDEADEELDELDF